MLAPNPVRNAAAWDTGLRIMTLFNALFGSNLKVILKVVKVRVKVCKWVCSCGHMQGHEYLIRLVPVQLFQFLPNNWQRLEAETDACS